VEAAVLPVPALEALAALLEYPREGAARRALDARVALEASAPAAARACAGFLAHAASAPLHELEELYARTFDWSPERALEVGWHLYGEQYDRGAFLVAMRERLRAHGVEEGENLPDHLATLLRLLARAGPAEAEALCARHLRPALERLVKGFEATPGNPYEDVVRAVGEAVAARGGIDR
jgi:nitrate reductase delta subunit